MRFRTALFAAFLGLAVWGALLAQNPFKQYPAFEYDDFPLPPNWDVKTEWTRARLRYPDITGYTLNQKLFYQNGTEYAGYWTMDYPGRTAIFSKASNALPALTPELSNR